MKTLSPPAIAATCKPDDVFAGVGGAHNTALKRFKDADLIKLICTSPSLPSYQPRAHRPMGPTSRRLTCVLLSIDDT